MFIFILVIIVIIAVILVLCFFFALFLIIWFYAKSYFYDVTSFLLEGKERKRVWPTAYCRLSVYISEAHNSIVSCLNYILSFIYLYTKRNIMHSLSTGSKMLLKCSVLRWCWAFDAFLPKSDKTYIYSWIFSPLLFNHCAFIWHRRNVMLRKRPI